MGWEIWTYIENMWESKVWGNHDKHWNITRYQMLQSTEFGTTPHQLGSFPKPFCLHSFGAKTGSSSLWRLAPGLFSPELIGLPKWQNMTKHDKTNHEKTNCPPIQSDPWWTQKSCPPGPAFAVLLLPPLSSEHFALPSKWKVWSAGNLPWFHSFQVHPPLECQAAGVLPCLAETDDSTTVARRPASSNSLKKGKNTHAEQKTWKNHEKPIYLFEDHVT